MDSLAIEGGIPLQGDVKISGAKNSVLPILAACLLAPEPVCIHNVPHLKDVTLFMELLGQMGALITVNSGLSIEVNSQNITKCLAPYELVSRMRASILVLGPLLTRFGQAKVALPGGCAIGSRPINLHVDGLKQMGADIHIDQGYIHAVAPKGYLVGATINMPFPSVTATENLILAATLAKGTTRIIGAAQEPEIIDLVSCLNTLGAQIKIDSSGEIVIDGVAELHAGEYKVLPDRIETGTYLVAAAITHGEITVHNTDPKSLEAVLCTLRKSGAKIECRDTSIFLSMKGRVLKPVDICTGPYPLFPTDMQAQFMALNCIAQGRSVVKETIFENRFMHVDELRRMGAQISVEGNVAVIDGGELTGAPVRATDLRASASLVLAGLVAKGRTVIHEVHHIDRGYECLEEKLAQLGARIRRISHTTQVNEHANT